MKADVWVDAIGWVDDDLLQAVDNHRMKKTEQWVEQAWMERKDKQQTEQAWMGRKDKQETALLQFWTEIRYPVRNLLLKYL